MKDIYSQIRSEVTDYTNNFVEIVYGYNFNTYETIKRCHSYYNSQFQDKSKISGVEKIFYNISKYRAKVASRMINYDTKDIRLWPLNPQSKLATFLLEKELKLWMKKHKIDRFLNEIARKAPVYGTVIIEKIKADWEKGIIDLRRHASDPTVDNIQESRFITTKYYLTDEDLRNMGKSGGWDMDKIAEVIRKDRNKNGEAPKAYPMRESNVSNVIRSSAYHEVWRRFGYVPKSWLDSDSGGYSADTFEGTEEMVKAVFIVANPFDIIRGSNGEQINSGTILFKSAWNKPWPFKDYHYDKTEGRYLGVGVIEDLFPAQERENEMANQKRLAMALSSLLIFQTQDPTIIQNVITDLQSGDVIRAGVNGGLTPLANEERNLAAFASEEQRYGDLADRMSFAYEALRGEQASASTPATSTVVQNQNATSEFAFRKENLGIVLRDYFNEMVLPEAVKELSAEHIMRFCGSVEEINFFDQEYAKMLADEKIINGEVEVEGEQDRTDLVQAIISKLKKQGKERFIQVSKDLYKNIEFEFDFMVDNEQENAALMAQNTFQVLTAIAQNPQVLQDPMIKPLFLKYAEIIGVNPLELEYAQQTQQANSQTQQMGSDNPMAQLQMAMAMKNKQGAEQLAPNI